MRKSVDMISARLLPGIIQYSLPIIFTSVLQLLFNAADLIVVGQFCGSISVGAVGATTAVTNLLVNFFMGLSIGTGVTVAQFLGARDGERVREIIHTAIPLAISGGLFLSVVGIIATEPLLRMMATPANVLPFSVTYMRLIFTGVVFNLLYNFGAAILRAAGDTRSPLIYLTLAGVINVILNLLFVMLAKMNVAGVALATVISQAISAALVLKELIIRRDACRLDWKQLRFRKGPILRIIRIGLPAGIQGALFSVSNVVIQSSINSFGEVLVAANAAAVSVEGFLYTIINAFQQTAVNFVGQNMGAHQPERVRKTVGLCLGCAVISMLVCSAAAYLMGPNLLSLYLGDSEQELAYAMLRMARVGLFYFLFCPMDIFTGALRGLGQSLLPMAMSVMGICVFRVMWVCTLFQISAFHTPEFLYASFPISWAITGLCQGICFFFTYRRWAKT